MRRGLTMTAVATQSLASAQTWSSFGYANGLTCRECGASFELGGQHACAECFGPLEVSYDLPAISREAIAAGPPNIWRYASLLPVPQDIASRRTTEPGRTPLVRADNLARTPPIPTLSAQDPRSTPP